MKREIVALEENVAKVISSRVFNSTIATATPARAGQKRTYVQDTQDHLSAKKMHLSFSSQCSSDTATTSNSPSAVVSSIITPYRLPLVTKKNEIIHLDTIS